MDETNPPVVSVTAATMNPPPFPARAMGQPTEYREMEQRRRQLRKSIGRLIERSNADELFKQQLRESIGL
jgi:hypothetical protein